MRHIYPYKEKVKAGSLIRKARLKRMLTLRAFSKLIGLSSTFVSGFERGHTRVPGPDKLRLIAAVLEIDYQDLLMAAKRTTEELEDILKLHPALWPALGELRQFSPAMIDQTVQAIAEIAAANQAQAV